MKNIKYKGMDAILLESEKLRVIVLASFAFKIVSIFHKEKNYEFLFQPQKDYYEKPSYGADFSDFDTSGQDECIPTIDPCYYEEFDSQLVDHGDVWTSEWDFKELGTSRIKASVDLESLPLVFEKTISLEADKIILDYRLINKSDRDCHYLWAHHGLLNYQEDSYLVFPKDLRNYINVQNSEVWDFDITKLKNFKENSTFKYYFTDAISQGRTALVHPDQGLKYEIKFDPKESPYLGVWLTTGGFKGEKNVAIEPCNGFYDSLTRAIANSKAKSVSAKGQDAWSLEINISDL